jgi:hypothetical protein
MGPKYPQLQVQLHSSNPFALVSAVRLAMRRSRIDSAEIDRFTEEALRREEPRDIQAVCASWAAVEVG